MPRKARILVLNYPHHIVQRGHNRNAVFLGDQDYQYYLENLREWKKELNCMHGVIYFDEEGQWKASRIR